MNTDKRLIMKFMGVEPTKFQEKWGWSDSPFFYCTADTEEEILNSIAEYIKYDSSWDVLMPVIRHIIDIIGVRTIDECTEEEWRMCTSITQMYIGVPIEWAYNYVVEWVKFYYRNIHTENAR